MKYIDHSIGTYLKDLGSSMPAPGGGSSAALAAAMAASLVSMACRFTLGRKKYEAYEDAVKKVLEKSVALEAKLAVLFDQDIQAYRAGDLKAAIAVPAEVCFLSYEILNLIEILLIKGNKNLLSDLAMAAALAEGSYGCCLFYIRVNRKMAHLDTSKHKKLEKEISQLSKKVKLLRKKAEVGVGKIIGR